MAEGHGKCNTTNGGCDCEPGWITGSGASVACGLESGGSYIILFDTLPAAKEGTLNEELQQRFPNLIEN